VGRAEPNGCDGLDAPCTHLARAILGPPVITAFAGGYALAFSELRADGRTGFDMHLQLIDRTGHVLSDHAGTHQFDQVASVQLALAATPTQLFLAQGTSASEHVPVPEKDLGILIERFDTSGTSLGTLPRPNLPPAGGAATQPALAVIEDRALFVAWTNVDAAGLPGDVQGRVVDLEGQPLFTGMACDTGVFSLSSQASGHRVAPSLATAGKTVLAVFGDRDPAPGGTDLLGMSVHARPFDLGKLVPALR
jgi:hypothetical protein